MKKFLVFSLLLAAALIVNAEDAVKYVFVLVGDGFGYNQRILTETLENRRLAISESPVYTRMGTLNAFGTVTDSAASGTALACGEKTYNSSIAMSVNGEKLESIAKKLKKNKGFSIGIISSSHLTDATLAAQYANRKSRSMYNEIGIDMAASGVEFFGGATARGDKTFGNLKNAGYVILNEKTATPETLAAEKVYLNSDPFTAWTKGDDKGARLTLADYTTLAAEKLSKNPNGFFMLVENGMTDYAGHGNDIGWAYREALALEEAFLAAKRFAAKHPAETLIIVTADHETGGLEIRDSFTPEKLGLLKKQKASVNTIAEKVKAMLPRLETVSSKNASESEKEKIISEIQNMLGLDGEPFTNDEKAVLIKELSKQKPSASGLVKKAFKIRDARIGLEYTTGGHSDKRVVTTAWGPGAEFFCDPLENADIPHLIHRAVFGNDASEKEYYVKRMAAVNEYKSAKPYRENSKPAKDLTVATFPFGSLASRVGEKTFSMSFPESKGILDFDIRKGDGFYFIGWTNKSKDITFMARPVFKNTEDCVKYCIYNAYLHGLLHIPSKDVQSWTKKDLEHFSFMIRPGETSSLLIAEKCIPLPDGKTPRLVTQEQRNNEYTACQKPIPLSLNVLVAAGEPVLDGSDNDAFWKNIAPVSCGDDSFGFTLKTAVDAAHENMYVFAEIKDSNIRSAKRERDGAVYDDDCIELFFCSKGHKTYHHLIVNPEASIYDAKTGDAKWNASFDAKTKRVANGWAVEIKIPLGQFAFKDFPIGNICIMDKPAGKTASFAPNGGDFHKLSTFVPLCFN